MIKEVVFQPSKMSKFLKSISSYFSGEKGEINLVLILLIVIVVLLATIIFYIFEERKRRKKIEELLKKKYESPSIKVDSEKRISRRTRVPDGIEIKVNFLDESEKGLYGFLLDISRGGIAIEPNFPLRRLYVDQVVNKINIIHEDINLIIKKAKVIRISHHMNQRLIAFKFLDVDDENREKVFKLISKIGRTK